MGKVELNISSDIRELLVGTEKLNSNVKELNKTTDDYQKKSQAGFNQTSTAANQATQSVNNVSGAASKATQIFKTLALSMGAVFSVAAIVAWGKTIVTSTDSGADAIERFKKGAASAFTFLNQKIATLDFSNLITGFENAYRAGKDFADSLDELEDRRRANASQTKDIDLEIIRQRTLAKTRSLDVKDREAAINEIIRLEELKLNKTKAITEKALKDLLDFADTNKKINEQEILDIVNNYDLYVDRINEGTTLSKELADIKANISSSNVSPEGVIIMREGATTIGDYNKRLAELTPLQKENIRLAENYNLVLGDQRDAISAAYIANRDADIALAQSAETLARIRNGITAEMNAANKKDEDANDIKKELELAEIKRQLQLFDAIVKSNAEFEKFIDKLSDENIDIDLGADPTGAIKDYEELQEVIARSTDAQRDEINKNIDQLEQWRKEGRITVDAYEEELARLQDALKGFNQFAEDHPLAAMLGIENEDQLNQIKDFVGQLADYVNEIVDQQVEATERIVDDQNQRIDEQQELVNREFELKKEGLANNFAIEDENLKKMQKARDEAIKEREKAIKLQRTLSTIESSISLVTASANIIKGFSGIPVVGVILGLAAVAAMIAGFISATSKVKDATQMEHGGEVNHGLLKGKRHTQGGIPINAEAGEWFINRQSSMKYSPLLDAINRNDEHGIKLFFDRKYLTKLPGQSTDRDYTKHLKDIERNTRNKKSELIYGNGFIIEKIGGYTKKINLN